MKSMVSIDWLASSLERDNVKVLDATWSLPGDTEPFPGQFIPGASFFDIDGVADLSSPMKHMLPSAKVFEDAVSALGIKNTDHVILYDRHGYFSAARAWWTFRMFGHDKVSILDGGLPAWMKAGHETAKMQTEADMKSAYEAKPALAKVISQSDLLTRLGKDFQIVDARSSGRFYGNEPEPREGLRSGHIPGSLNLPFGSVRDSDLNLRPLSGLAEIVGRTGVDLSKPIITTCGSGITAAALAFIFHRLGAEDVTVYDGSWAEWGASDAPIEV